MTYEMYCLNPKCDLFNAEQEIPSMGGYTEPREPVRDACSNCGAYLYDDPIYVDDFIDDLYSTHLNALGNFETMVQKWRASYTRELTGVDSDDPQILAEAYAEYYENLIGDLETEEQRTLLIMLLASNEKEKL